MRCGAFGDMVLLTAMIKQLHLRLGQPVDVISSGAWTLPLLAGQPGVGEIFVLGSRRAPYWVSAKQRALVNWLRRRGAGPTWFCDPGPVGRGLLRRGGIPDSYICEDSDHPYILTEHFVDRWIRLASLTPPAFAGRLAPVADRAPRQAVLEIKQTSRAMLDEWLRRRGIADRPLTLIQAGNKRTMRRGFRRRATNTKYWPEARWAGVIRELRAEQPDHAIVLLGVRAEYEMNAEIAQLAAVDGIHNVADDLPIEILLPLLERADSLISVDTGPAHAAAALGCPTVALFGISKPSWYRPGGVTTPAIALTGEVNGARNILGIDVASVMQAWRELRHPDHDLLHSCRTSV